MVVMHTYLLRHMVWENHMSLTTLTNTTYHEDRLTMKKTDHDDKEE